MKKLLVLTGIALLFSGCSSKTEIKDVEAYCTSFGEVCSENSQNKNLCEICGDTKVSNYVSCHSKEFCQNTPIQQAPPKEPIGQEEAWQSYKSTDYNFELKYPPNWKVESFLPGRPSAGQTENRIGLDPATFDFTREGEIEPEISIYIAPPGGFSCPVTGEGGIAVKEGEGICLDGTLSALVVDQESTIIKNVEEVMKQGDITKYCPKPVRDNKEIFLCKGNTYFRFSTTNEQEDILNEMLSTFKFLE